MADDKTKNYHDELRNLAVEFLSKYDIWYTQDVYNLMDDAIDVYEKYYRES